MAGWYNSVVEDLSKIVQSIEHYENELQQAKYECSIKGSLEKSSAALPGLTEFRFNQLQEIEAILEHLNIELRKERSRVFRKYLDTGKYARVRLFDDHVDNLKALLDLGREYPDVDMFAYKADSRGSVKRIKYAN